MFGCCGRKRGDDRGRADLKHNAGHQLLGQLAEEGLAECRQLDGQGVHVSTKAAILDISYTPE